MEMELNPREMETLERETAEFRPVEPARIGVLAKGITANTAVRKSQSSFRYISIAVAMIIAIVGVKYIPTTQTAPKTYSTKTAQRATITLASGAQVVLAPSTTLQDNGNNITLTGQAVFTVPHSSSSPFTVKTKTATIRVLGTTFSVNSYDGNALVAVAEGKVAVNSGIISAGDVASVDDAGATRITHDANVASQFSWTTGKLSFEEIPFAKLALDLERWYNIEIQITDKSLAQQPVTITLDASSRDEALSSLSTVLGATLERNGRKITFNRKTY